jgi:simple sugar transport system ATP-binding protein
MGTVDRADASEESLASLMFGFTFERTRTLSACGDAPVLTVDGLRGRVVESLSLSVCDGEVVGIAALPRNGGEELAELLGGTIPPVAGSLRIGGVDLSVLSPRRRATAGLSYVPEDSINEGTVAQFSVAENFALGRTSAFAASALGISVVRWKQVFRAARVLRDQFEVVYDRLRQPVATLSGGNIQRMMVARAVDSDPTLLVLMHPTKCLDVNGARQVMDWVHGRIEDPKRRLRAAVIVSPDLEELLGNCHKILILYRGRTVGAFDGSDLTDRVIDEMGRLLTGKRAGEEDVKEETDAANEAAP